jgi:hypothetical protein
MTKKLYIFRCSATDNGTVARLTDREAEDIYSWIKALPTEIEFWLVPAEKVSYNDIINAIDTDLHDQLKKKPFLPLRPKEKEGRAGHEA